jgi:hypothetical protein
MPSNQKKSIRCEPAGCRQVERSARHGARVLRPMPRAPGRRRDLAGSGEPRQRVAMPRPPASGRGRGLAADAGHLVDRYPEMRAYDDGDDDRAAAEQRPPRDRSRPAPPPEENSDDAGGDRSNRERAVCGNATASTPASRRPLADVRAARRAAIRARAATDIDRANALVRLPTTDAEAER